jgi:hypothetical protein
MEMLAVACHELAASLFQQTERNDHYERARTWQPVIWSYPPGATEPVPTPYPEPPPPTVFRHSFYRYFDQYPKGIADMVGYWAEARLFGGVVLFDRGKDEIGVRISSVTSVSKHSRLISSL